MPHQDTEDTLWLEHWIERWGDRMTRFAYTYVEDRGTAEDLAQEAFLRLFRHHQAHPHEDPRPAWLFTVVYRLAMDHRRRRQLEARVAGFRGETASSDADTRLLVQDLVDRLPERDRACVWLFYYGDLSVKEIAEALATTPSEVKTRLYRARRRIGALWRENDA
jgi:RNA polymerase sigma-70 factor (ECF subfamily)